jgi:hypothetical protein
MKKVKILLTVLLITAGCAQTQKIQTVQQVCLLDTNKEQLMQTAQDVLGQMHFAIEKSDAEQGYIRTRPLAGAQFFEFWRNDNVGAFNEAEANMHSIRRTAELNISQQGEQLCIGCDVKVQRLSMPEQAVTGSARAYTIFSKSKSSLQTLELNPEQKRQMAWLDLGDDTRLSTVILQRIEKQLKGTAK